MLVSAALLSPSVWVFRCLARSLSWRYEAGPIRVSCRPNYGPYIALSLGLESTFRLSVIRGNWVASYNCRVGRKRKVPVIQWEHSHFLFRMDALRPVYFTLPPFADEKDMKDMVAYFTAGEWTPEEQRFLAATQPFRLLIRMPFWAVSFLFASYPTIAFIRGPFRRWRRRRRGLCTKCGYDLTANESGVCSECGTEVPNA